MERLRAERAKKFVAVRKAIEAIERGHLMRDPLARLGEPGHRPVAHHVEHRRRHAGPLPGLLVLVEHPEGLFLFDSGYDLEHVEAVLPFELPEQTPEQTLPAQLAGCGVQPDDVTTLVISHLHFDHVGGNRHFPSATVLIHAREIAQARSPEPFERLGYSDTGFDTMRPDLKSELLEGAPSSPGLQLFETPGHTVGPDSLLVTASQGAGRCSSPSTSSTRGRLRQGHAGRLPQRPDGRGALHPPDQGPRRGARRGNLLHRTTWTLALPAAPDVP